MLNERGKNQILVSYKFRKKLITWQSQAKWSVMKFFIQSHKLREKSFW